MASQAYRLRHRSNLSDSSSESGDASEILGDDASETGRPLLPVHPALDVYRTKLKVVVEDNRFQTFVVSLIALNSILMGVNTYLPNIEEENDPNVIDYPSVSPTSSPAGPAYTDSQYDAAKAVSTLDTVFLILFTIELGLNVFVYLHGLFKDGWLVFDFLTIALSWAFSSFTIIRSFRIFRAFRLFGRVPSLKKIIKAIGSTAEGMMSIVFVLFILFYIFAVMFTQLFGECYDLGCYCEDDSFSPDCPDKGVNYFGRLDLTFFTLMMLMTMDDWYTIIKETQNKDEWAWFPIIIFMLISGLVMLNLVIAVLCEALAELESDEAEDEEEVDEDAKKFNEKEFSVNGEPVLNVGKMEDDELKQLFHDLYEETMYLRARDEETDATIEYLTTQVTMLEKLAAQALQQSGQM